jgi:CheY-like chemotaxis protein
VRDVLAGEGALVLAAGSGEEAIALAERHDGPIHLLLTDVVMPGLTGRETAERVVARRPEVRVLFVSGYSDDAILAQGLRQARFELLEKPFTPSALVARLGDLLARGARAGERPISAAAAPEAPP